MYVKISSIESRIQRQDEVREQKEKGNASGRKATTKI